MGFLKMQRTREALRIVESACDEIVRAASNTPTNFRKRDKSNPTLAAVYRRLDQIARDLRHDLSALEARVAEAG